MAKLLSIRFIIGLLVVLCLANTISAIYEDGTGCFWPAEGLGCISDGQCANLAGQNNVPGNDWSKKYFILLIDVAEKQLICFYVFSNFSLFWTTTSYMLSILNS